MSKAKRNPEWEVEMRELPKMLDKYYTPDFVRHVMGLVRRGQADTAALELYEALNALLAACDGGDPHPAEGYAGDMARDALYKAEGRNE